MPLNPIRWPVSYWPMLLGAPLSLPLSGAEPPSTVDTLGVSEQPKAPALPLAKAYRPGLNLTHYWMSEKLDGMRAYWDGTQLSSRSGHKIHAPGFFLAQLPAHPLDGELWLGRGQFEALMAIVRDRVPDEAAWRQVRFMLFDAPDRGVIYEQRYRHLATLLSGAERPQLARIEHRSIQDEKQLQAELARIVAAGGEGVVLRHRQGLYLPGRSDELLKLKSYQDDEAVVLAHLPGKGQFRGMMGSLLVEDRQGRQFRIGSGFTHAQRREPPEVGTVITYRFNGRTASGLPRFARFDRTFVAF
ncbi:DNA ligase [Ferrimonas gelatinilytica]|uniref:DNA ligase n=1 Tax=Ferrimonas gelatinilytica TaxID=1255257 RepID=A0ABP9SDY1_9GAMM